MIKVLRKLPSILRNKDFAKAKELIAAANPNDEGLGEFGGLENLLGCLQDPSFCLMRKWGAICHCGNNNERELNKVTFRF